MSIHENSLEAYYSGQSEAFTKRENMILTALNAIGMGTDREIMEHLNLPDMNAVRPRITELINKGVLYELTTTKDHLTGKSVRIVRIRPNIDRDQPVLPGLEAVAS